MRLYQCGYTHNTQQQYWRASLVLCLPTPLRRMASPPKTQEELDEERLRELEAKIADVAKLLSEGNTRQHMTRKVKRAREQVASGDGEARPLLTVYHSHAGMKIPTTRRTQSKMELVRLLKEQERANAHPHDLEHALHTYVREQLEIMERKVARK